jgi:TPR repeat protein
MNEKDNFALVPRPPGALEKAELGAKRILSGMVADTLALTKKASSLRIVVVNDEEGPIESIKFILRKCFNKDTAVVTFDDSEKAWQELLRIDPDLLITDDIMPALGGMEIVRRLADKRAAYPVILTTAFERTELLMCVRDCASRGLNIKLLNAPWDLESFLKAVEDSLKIPRAIARPDAETPPVVADTELENWFQTGEKYYFGQGVPQDYAEAVRWYRKAAEQNHAEAQYALGYCYENGEGVEQDYVEAVRWYRRAAEQNFAPAQYNLGDCYRRGEGVQENMAEAVQWYRKAAEQGDADAQYKLGLCYQDGRGVVKDEAEAEKWQDKAREKWRKNAEDQLLTNSQNYEKIAIAFIDLLALHAPLIGDCSLLPYPKKTIHYAIAWVLNDYENKREAATNQTLREKYDKIIPTFRYALTRLVSDWHEIEREDKEAITRLSHFDSFPDWALPLKLKYLDDERARNEACDMAIQVLADKVERKKGGGDF